MLKVFAYINSVKDINADGQMKPSTRTAKSAAVLRKLL